MNRSRGAFSGAKCKRPAFLQELSEWAGKTCFPRGAKATSSGCVTGGVRVQFVAKSRDDLPCENWTIQYVFMRKTLQYIFDKMKSNNEPWPRSTWQIAFLGRGNDTR